MLEQRRGGEKRRWSDANGGDRDGQTQRRSSRSSLSLSSPLGNGNTAPKGLFGLVYKHDEPLLSLSFGTKNKSVRPKRNLFSALAHPLQEEVDEVRHLDDHYINGKQFASKSTDGQECQDHHRYRDDSWLPEQRTLGLVLDILQRRDTYEIFAEPVDPSEVEEYYEIIKEPMDFGTMRAKLHEGMYKNLQEFERDVFLIFGNAMHFNSSATVYFRQARALEDLAKKVFHALRCNPENFESEFAAIRRRSSRRLHDEPGASDIGTCQKLMKHLGSNSMSTDIGRKGCRRDKTSHMTRVDRRCTYKPWMSLLDTDSTISPIQFGAKALVKANQEEDISYKKSLMSFVKDLGPTAQKVAKRKLVETLGFSQFSAASAPEIWGSSKSRVSTDQGNPSDKKVIGIANEERIHQSPVVAKELEHIEQVRSFDLNQVQVGSSSSSHTIDCSQDDSLNGQVVSNTPSLESGGFIFNLPYLKSRLRELNDIGGSSSCMGIVIRGHNHAEWQLGSDNKSNNIRFDNTFGGYTNQNEFLYLNNLHVSPFENTPHQATLNLQL